MDAIVSLERVMLVKSRQIMMLAVLWWGMGSGDSVHGRWQCEGRAMIVVAADPGKAMGDFSKDSQAIYKEG